MRVRCVLSDCCSPPKRNVAGNPSETATMGWLKSPVPVLMQKQPRPRNASVNQTGVGAESRKSGFPCSSNSESEERGGHIRPGPVLFRVDMVIPIASSVCHPSQPTAVRHGDGHAVSTGCYHVAKRRAFDDGMEGRTIARSPYRAQSGGNRRPGVENVQSNSRRRFEFKQSGVHSSYDLASWKITPTV